MIARDLTLIIITDGYRKPALGVGPERHMTYRGLRWQQFGYDACCMPCLPHRHNGDNPRKMVYVGDSPPATCAMLADGYCMDYQRRNLRRWYLGRVLDR